MDIRSLKDRERKFREKEIPFGEFTVRTKSRWFSEVELRNVLGYLGAHDGDSVIDVGCSDGRFLEYLHARMPKCPLYGVDFAVNPLKALADKGIGSFQACADACDLPFREASFDRAVSIQVIQQIPSKSERIKALKGINCVLRSGGAMVLTVLNRRWWYNLVENGKEGQLTTAKDLYVYLYDPEDLKSELEEAGFFVLGIVGINNVPARYLKQLGVVGVLMDTAVTRFFPSLSRKRGCYFLASCRKKLT